MAVRQDIAQLIINIDTQESRDYQKTLDTTKQLVKDLKKAEVGSDEYNDALRKVINSSQALSKVDVLKLTAKQLRDRRRQLFQFRDTLTQTQFAASGLEAELLQVNTALTEQGRRTRQTQQRMGLFRRSLIPLGATIAATFAVGRVFDFFKTLVTGSAQLDAVERRFNTVFGSSQDLIEGWAESTANSLGLTVDEYKKVTAASGDLLVPIGFQRSEAAGLSKDITEISAALAIWEGGQRSTAEVTNIINKALLGEREQLKELGVSIKEVDVTQRLAAKGQQDLTGELLKQAKALATLEIITENSTDAINAFADGSDDANVKEARLTATIREQVEEWQKGLIPAYSAFLDIAADAVAIGISFINTIRAIPGFLRENKDEMVLLGVAIISFNSANIAAIASTLGLIAAQKLQVIWSARSAISFKALNVVMRANPVGFVIGLLASLALGFKVLYDRSQTVRAGISGLFSVLKAGFAQIVRGAKIFAKELDLAISIKPSTRARLREEIKALKDEAEEAEKSGQTVGSAFAKGYNDRIKSEAEAAVKEEEQRRALEEAEKRAREKELADLAAQEKLETDRRNRAIALQERIAAEKEEADRIAKIKADRAGDNIGPAASIDTLDATEVILDPSTLQELADERLATLQEVADREFTQLEINALKTLTSEEQYEQLRLDKQIEFYERRLGILEAAGLTETDQYEQIELEKLRLEKERQDKSLENEARTQKLKNDLIQEGLDSAKSVFGAFAGLLEDDEKNRSKNASAIKAFKTAEITISGAAEVQKIFEATAGIPLIGQIIAGVKAAAAVIRTVSAVRKVNSTKFFDGGDTGPGIFTDPTDGKVVAGIVHKNEYVVPEWMNTNPILAPVISGLERIRKKGSFFDGGQTTRQISVDPTGLTPDSVSSNNNIGQLMQVVDRLSDVVAAFPAESRVSLTSLDSAQNTVNNLEKLSSF